MAGTFTVKSDELLRQATSMSSTAAELDQMSSFRGDVRRELGHDGVADQLSDFFQHGSDGLHRVSEHLDGLAQRLRLAAEAYDEVECAIVEQAGGSW